jgi:hypothetical protein
MPQFIIGELAWGRGKMVGDNQHSVKLQLPRNEIIGCGNLPIRPKPTFREDDFTGLGAGLHETESVQMD